MMLLLNCSMHDFCGGARHGVSGCSERGAKGAAIQQLQQQQQPATRHRSTARRLVSMSSTRADTSCSLPNGDVIGPTAVPAPTAGHRLSVHPRSGSAAGRPASKMKVVGSDNTERRRAAPGLASISISTCATWSRSLADLIDHAAHLGARSAPRCAEMHDGRSVRGQAEVGGVDVVGRVRIGRLDLAGPAGHQPADEPATASAATTATSAEVTARPRVHVRSSSLSASSSASCSVEPVERDR